MKPAVCLRCDWAGETGADTCPQCGERLYRAADPSRAERRTRGHERTTPPSAEVEYDHEPVRRSRPLAVLALVAAILISGTAVFFRTFTESAEPPAGRITTPPQPGTLVFVVSAAADRARLWRWDLSTGIADLGPIVDRPLELARATVGSTDSVGVLTKTPGGRHRAWLLPFPNSGSGPEPLLIGEPLAWSSDGKRVVGVRPAVDFPGCDDASWITSYDLATEASVFDLRVCGDVTSIARAGITTFFTQRSPSGSSIEYVGVHRSHEVLGGSTLLGASPTGDLLVVAGDRASSGAAQLFWQGNRAGAVPYSVDGQRLMVDRILAWSPVAAEALVLGRVDSRAGVWLIRTGAASIPPVREPELVVRVDGPGWATYAADGTAYIDGDGGLWSFRDGRLSPMQPPPGVPTPDRPLVWLP